MIWEGLSGAILTDAADDSDYFRDRDDVEGGGKVE